MAATVGTASQFDQKQKTLWNSHSFFTANGATDETKKTKIPLISVGTSTYSLMRNFLLPENPSGNTFGEIVTLTQSHFNPDCNMVVENLKFNSN